MRRLSGAVIGELALMDVISHRTAPPRPSKYIHVYVTRDNGGKLEKSVCLLTLRFLYTLFPGVLFIYTVLSTMMFFQINDLSHFIEYVTSDRCTNCIKLTSIYERRQIYRIRKRSHSSSDFCDWHNVCIGE